MQCAIDPRLCPLEVPVRVPLYPQTPTLPDDHGAASKLQSLLAKTFNVPHSHVVLTSSGSLAIKIYLLSKKIADRKLKVAIPSYACISVLAAAKEVESSVVLLDVDQSGDIELAEFERVVKEKVDVLLWPNHFAYKTRPIEILRFLRTGGVSVLLDEAQSFPAPGPYADDLKEADGTILSFGPSKRVASGSGGALISSRPQQRIIEKERFQSVQEERPIFNRLDNLMKIVGLPAIEVGEMKSEVASSVVTFLDRQKQLEQHHLEQYNRLANVMAAKGLLGVTDAAVSAPTIAAFKIPRHDRFDLMASLAGRGIQSTWYYWPLHLNPHGKFDGRRSMKSTESFVSELIILPCQWKHREEQISMLCEALHSW